MKHASLFLAPCCLLALSSAASAQTLISKIDSYTGSGDFILACPCFVAGEEAAVWLTAPCDGRIIAVQVYWDSIMGGPSGPVDAEVRIYRAGTFPVPGAQAGAGPITSLNAGVDTNGELNDVPLTGSGVSVDAGQEFVVSFRFHEDATDFLNSPSVNFDEAVTPGANAIYADGQGWVDGESLGILGDWVIRAVIECGDPIPGACCLPQTICALYSENECEDADGVWQGEDTVCPSDCPKLCDGDVTGDGDTTVADFNLLAGSFGESVQPGHSGDLTGEGQVDVADFNLIAGNFGCRND